MGSTRRFGQRYVVQIVLVVIERLARLSHATHPTQRHQYDCTTTQATQPFIALVQAP